MTHQIENDMRKHHIAALAMALFALAAAVEPNGAEAASTSGAGQSVTNRSVARSSPTNGHLYVLDFSNAVYRFPLAQDGLPATKPDGVLYPMWTARPLGLAVDKVGHIFVDYGTSGVVAEFAAGATGHRLPISILYVANYPDHLKSDDAGRLYLHLNGNRSIAIFAKGAQGHDAPISIVANSDASDYVSARSGALYTVSLGCAVAVYNDPLNNPTQPDRLIWPDGRYNCFTDSLAIDVANDRLYIQFDQGNNFYYNKVNYDVRTQSGGAVASALEPWILTGQCAPKFDNYVGGTMIIKNYLIVSCSTDPDVFVYHADKFGRHGAPFEVVGDKVLTGPWEIAVGP
jgi:hypothetical protein